nr:Beta-ketoacyl synthase [uncultured bacterium]
MLKENGPRNYAATTPSDEIAIIGMAGRFPGAASVGEFWQNVLAGLETITVFSDRELLASGADPAALKDPLYVKARGVIDGVELFDASFFGFNRREAEITDPQHRLFLQTAWHALEDAGYCADSFDGRVGVFAGSTLSTYLFKVLSNPQLIHALGLYRILLGNDKDYLSTWTSYKLDLTGPSFTVQTACSTSLVAAHLACQSLNNGECDMALAGGVSVNVPHRAGYYYREGGINSPDGHCRAFDAKASGTVGGNGVGVVVLRRLKDALAQGDFIYAVIKGSAINNDGSGKAGYTAPSMNGQAEVIAEAQAMAGVEPDTIRFIEAHGTGTPLGDPIEMAALTKVFAESTQRRGFCAIGSVKTNVGHLDAAAGVTGLIKAALALRHRRLPPSLHFEQPNPKIDFEASPFYVCTKVTDFGPADAPLRAGVSSFGIGGTNAHMVLEQAPPLEPSTPSRDWQLLLLSAKTDSALEASTTRLSEFLKSNAAVNLADAAYTLQVGRKTFKHRRAVICNGTEDALSVLGSKPAGRVLSTAQESVNRQVAFMFPGQGTQRVNMAREIYQKEKTFSDLVDTCSQLLEPHLGLDLRTILFPESDAPDESESLNQTFITQPALFVIEYALARLWMEWGVRPAMMIGHSIGEYVAACLAGVFSLEDGLSLIAARGRLMQQLPPGDMIAVPLPESRVAELLNDRISLASVNGPSQCVVSGDSSAIGDLDSRLSEQNIICRRLHTSHAFHSFMMEAIGEPFIEHVRKIKLHAPQVPYVSNITGTFITAAEATQPRYWVEHLCRTVRFSEGLNEIVKERDVILLEVGPGRVLTALARQNKEASRHALICSTGTPPESAPDEASMTAALGRLWLEGVEINWPGFYRGQRRRRIPLPTYPFESVRCWVDVPAGQAGTAGPESQDHEAYDHQANQPAPQSTGIPEVSAAYQTEVDMSSPHLGVAARTPRQERILSELKEIIEELTGAVPEEADLQITYFELGIDSLLLIQASQSIQQKFGVKISFTKMFEELSTINSLVTYLDEVMPKDALQEPSIEQAQAATPAAQPRTTPEPSATQGPAAALVAPSKELALASCEALRPPDIERVEARPAAPPYVAQPAPAQPSHVSSPLQLSPSQAPARHAGSNGQRSSAGEIERIFTHQLDVVSQLMQGQLDLLRGRNGNGAYTAIEQGARPYADSAMADSDDHLTVANDEPAIRRHAQAEPLRIESVAAAGVVTSAPAASKPVAIEPAGSQPAAAVPGASKVEHYVPYKPIEVGAKGGLPLREQQFLEDFLQRYSARTRESKRLTQHFRPYLADSRVSVLFRMLWKEIAYPIMGQRAQGARVWDVDGNEYIDITLGFGVHLFGHSPQFITRAIEQQFKESLALGPQTEMAGRAAQMISEMAHVDRVNFCNSGTEALIGVMRIARTIRNRSKIAMFAGSYHGWSDSTLIRPLQVNGELKGVPGAPGVSPKSIEDMIVLEYGDPKSLDIIKANANDLAAVLVEPVQSRRPDLQPKEYLHELRDLTRRTGVLLIFDEMITGFRSHPGGAQAVFGVEADLVTYGKVIGGGMPIGVVAGKAPYMDAFDGGMWSFGDGSYPEAEKTLMAGCYFKHPLTMAASLAVLEHLKAGGPAIQEQLNRRTAQMAERLNTYFRQNNVPAQVTHFASLFRFSFGRELKYPELFFFLLAHKGIFTWEGGNYYLCTAHTDEDVEYLIRAVIDSIEELREAGFLPEPPDGSPGGGKHLGGKHLEGLPSSISESRSPSQSSGRENGGRASCAAPRPGGFSATEPRQAEAENTGGQSLAYVMRDEREDRFVAEQAREVKFSLYYFGNYAREYSEDKYKLLIESARLADRLGFDAIWIPERHFNSFGGFSPNPSVLGAAIARETERIKIRAGSVVLPLHNPIRVAEEWSVVDNLSRGRVGISFASGWHPNDFAFAPDSFDNRHEVMYEGIEVVHRLWKGESIKVRDGAGSMIDVRLVPMPMQPTLPTWLTVASIHTARRAGEIGAGFLTNFMDHAIEEVKSKIDAYRDAIREQGRDPRAGHVTIQLHTFIGNDLEQARQKVRKPFIDYLGASFKLLGNKVKSQGGKIDFNSLSEDDLQFILSSAFDQYVAKGALFGTPESCRPTIDKLREAGADEVCCLIDFGIDLDAALEGLYHLNDLRKLYESPDSAARDDSPARAAAHQQEAIRLRDTEGDTALAGARRAPLTDTQAQLWALSRISDDVSSAYNESIAIHLRGSIDLDVMRLAVQEVVDRHEALRTTFGPEGDYQQFHPVMKIDVPLMDFSGLSEGERRAQLDAWIKREISQPLDLTNGPLVRFRIAKLAEDHHVLLWTNHHIIVDGDSVSVLLNDLSAIYMARCGGSQYTLPEPMKYSDYARLRADQQQSQEIEDSERYWLDQFKDSIPLLDLPTDRPRPSVQTFSRATYSRSVGLETYEAVRKLGAAKGATMFMTLLAGFKVLMHHLTGQRQITVMINTADSSFVRRKDLVGYRVHPLAVGTTVSGDVSFSDYFASVRKQVLQAYEHQNVSLNRLSKRLKAWRDTGRLLPVSVGINLSNETESSAGLFGLNADVVAYPTTNPLLDIYLDIAEKADELLLRCNYNPDLFDEMTIARWMKGFETLLAKIAADPTRPVSELSLLDDDQERKLLVEWNATAQAYPMDCCIHEGFQKEAAVRPDKIAFKSGDHQVTFGEINRRANQVAHYLKALGVGPGAIVATYLDRSIELMVGLIGVHKTGAAFAAMDPGQMAERTSYILDDTRAPVVLTRQALIESLPQYWGDVICLDGDWDNIAYESCENVSSGASADMAAYVIYTSGSTGTPKGVVLPHRALMNRLAWMWKTFPFSAGDVCCQKTNITFADSLWEIFGPLLQGVTTVIIPEEDVKQPDRLIDMLSAEGVTRLVVVPSLLRLMLERGSSDIAGLASLKLLVTSGEPLTAELCNRYFEVVAGTRLLNLYGCSEVSADSTFYEVEMKLWEKAPPIGKPIANTRVYILDSQRRPVDVEAEGELHISGPGLALGYLNRPELTSERFLPNPFAVSPGERMYRTGDVTRFLPDGNIEYLGRIDHQVKIRGFRVELGEIEAHLRQHPAISQAAVVARGEGADASLAAYVVPKGGLKEKRQDRAVDFSLFYFAEDASNSSEDKYRLCLEGAKFADRHGFEAVWTPERHFHEVAGIYPNPSVLSAALAMVTERVKLRAGSVVLPHHRPIRVAEEWSVVDNLSNGRVGVSFTSGWVPNDFAFFPEHFRAKREVMLDGIEQVRKLWRGESVPAIDGVGNEFRLNIFPRPKQAELPTWLTCTGDPAMFERAGMIGANVLTALLAQTVEEAAEKIALYRESRARHGFDPEAGVVTMMLHTYVGEDEQEVLEKVREPFHGYMRAHVGLFESLVNSLNVSVDSEIKENVDLLVALAFERYYWTASLIGSTTKCMNMIERMRAIGVNEIACLIDFGLDFDSVMEGLRHLTALKDRAGKPLVLTAGSVRSYLRERLPDYMAPSQVVVLDALPLTSTGKLNRRALPVIDASKRDVDSDFAEPRTETERLLSDIWAQVLGLEKVGINDNFFELGGDSILGVRAAVRANKAGLKIAPLQLFQYQTLAELAAAIEPLKAASAEGQDFNWTSDELEEIAKVIGK